MASAARLLLSSVAFTLKLIVSFLALLKKTRCNMRHKDMQTCKYAAVETIRPSDSRTIRSSFLCSPVHELGISKPIRGNPGSTTSGTPATCALTPSRHFERSIMVAAVLTISPSW